VTQTKQQVILRKKSSGVAVLLIDCPGKVNLLTSEVMREIADALLDVEADPAVKALAILSGKPDTFVSGADLHEILRLRDIEEARRLSARGQAVISKLAWLAKPTVVGINGACLGGGLELALGADWRVASDDPGTVLGLPEVRLGIIPGMGGTQRLPRLVGLRTALDKIISSDLVPAAAAKEIGLVDEIVGQDDLLAACQQAALKLAEDRSVWKAARHRQAAREEPEREEKSFALTQRSVRIRTKGQYPAPMRAIEVIRHGLERGFEEGLAGEARAFAELAVTDHAKNLINIFFNTEFARQTAAVLAARMQSQPVTALGVVGSGMMGIAVAQLAALSGHRVLFMPTSRGPRAPVIERLNSSISHMHQAQASAEEPAQALARIQVLEDEPSLAASHLILEAVFEDEELKRQLFQRLEAIAAPGCLLASNTSSLSITKMASGLADSGRFVGMHFFHPVDRMPLVEIISHRGTRRETLARAAGFAFRLGKIPIMVNDGPGFLVNRLLCPYFLEAARLAQEGVPLNWIDEAALDFGMAMGPLVVLDEIGMDIGIKTADTLHKAFGQRMAPPAVFERVRGLGMVGRKTGTGVYCWDESGKRLSFNPRLIDEVGLSVSDRKVPAEEGARIVERLVLPMVDEAARCLEEKIVRKPREVDLAMVLGTGFPPYRGGPLRYADLLGMPALRASLERIYAGDGSGRSVSRLIQSMEAEGRRFYSRTADGDEG